MSPTGNRLTGVAPGWGSGCHCPPLAVTIPGFWDGVGGCGVCGGGGMT